jgi:hypothetical protein
MMELLKGKHSSLIPGVTSSVASMGVFGAVAGGTIAAVSNSVRVAKGKISGPEAVTNTAKEAVGTGLCTAAGVAAMRALGSGGVVGFIAFFAVAGIVKTIWDSVFSCQQTSSEKAGTAK